MTGLIEYPATPDPTGGVFLLPSATTSILESAKTLFEVIAKRKRIFNRANTLVECTTDENGAVLTLITPEAFRSRIEGYERPLMVWGNSDNQRVLRPTRCSLDTAKALMATEAAKNFCPINIVTKCPILGSAGQILGRAK